MNARASMAVPPAAAQALLAFLGSKGQQYSVADALSLAIADWIARNSAPDPHPEPPSDPHPFKRGYQWKEVFLPDRTQLRMFHDGRSYFALVEGDAIVFQGDRVSPRQLTMRVAGDGRNAWRELSLLLPDEKRWKPAARLRHEVRAANATAAPPSTLSPIETMNAAADSMAKALGSALSFVQLANEKVGLLAERRGNNLRRRADVLAGDCQFD